jgi:LysM repeat protein
MKTKAVTIGRGDNEVRDIILKFLFNRNKSATSRMGKNGSYVKISDLKSALKLSHLLKQTEVISNLNYLISQGWVEEKVVTKNFITKQGHSIPSETEYYCITAHGIDKIDGPSPFTNDKFSGIKIEATGQNIITLGDGNQINAKFKESAEALRELKESVKHSRELNEESKFEIVSDIETIQGQLAKSSPNKSVVSTMWDSIEKASAVGGLMDLTHKVAHFLTPFIS